MMSLISTIVVGSGGLAAFSFSNIPQSGKDLLIAISARNNGGDGINISLNGDNTGFSWVRLYSDGSARVMNTGTTATLGAASNGATTTADVFASTQLYIPNYASTSSKPMFSDQVGENFSSSNAYMQFRSTNWSGTSPITSITFTGEANFVQHSTASLYIIS